MILNMIKKRSLVNMMVKLVPLFEYQYADSSMMAGIPMPKADKHSAPIREINKSILGKAAARQTINNNMI